MDTRLERLELPGFPEGGANVNRVIIAKGNQRQLVYYWYHSRGRIIAQDWKKLVALFWDRATLRRTDGSLLRFTIPVYRDRIAPADETLREIASRVLLRLPPFVPGRNDPSRGSARIEHGTTLADASGSRGNVIQD
jgi:EpsI family protein